MANDIGNFFQAESNKEQAVNGIAEHLRKFWEPRMRRDIVAYAQHDGTQLADLVREAVLRLDAK
ncbi:MAG: formate dehydrogenase subunit delta [Gammaproteobacteria bacterium]